MAEHTASPLVRELNESCGNAISGRERRFANPPWDTSGSSNRGSAPSPAECFLQAIERKKNLIGSCASDRWIERETHRHFRADWLRPIEIKENGWERLFLYGPAVIGEMECVNSSCRAVTSQLPSASVSPSTRFSPSLLHPFLCKNHIIAHVCVFKF